MKRRRETPEQARVNSEQYGIAFRDRPAHIEVRANGIRKLIELLERHLVERRAYVHFLEASRETHGKHFVGRGEMWSATYSVRKQERELAVLKAQLEGLLKGAAERLGDQKLRG